MEPIKVKQTCVEQMLMARYKNASPKYRRAIMLVLRGTTGAFYGSSTTSTIHLPRRKRGQGFMAAQIQYNGCP